MVLTASVYFTLLPVFVTCYSRRLVLKAEKRFLIRFKKWKAFQIVWISLQTSDNVIDFRELMILLGEKFPLYPHHRIWVAGMICVNITNHSKMTGSGKSPIIFFR